MIKVNRFLVPLPHALRSLLRDWRFSAATIVTFALTIGATTAVFTIIDAVLLRPLAYDEFQRLVVIREIIPELSHLQLTLPANPRHFAEWQRRTTSFEQLAEFLPSRMNMMGQGDAAQVTVMRASGNLFDVLGTRSTIGRTLRRDDERPGGEPVVVLTHGLWRARFHADRSVIGRSIRLDGKPHTIVGVLPADFRLLPFQGVAGPVMNLGDPDAFTALTLDLGRIRVMADFNYNVIARLKPGVTVKQASVELNGLQADIVRSAPGEKVHLKAQITPILDAIVGRARRGLLLLMASVLVVLVIACSNLANLSLTRTIGRLRDTAICTALGASRGSLIWQVLVDHSMLAALGGMCGLVLARIALLLLVPTAPLDLPRGGIITLDGRAVAFAALIACAAGLFVAVLPTWRIAGSDVQSILRNTSSATTEGKALAVTRSAMLVVQVALSVTLLVVAAALLISFLRIALADRGFQSDGIVAVDVTLPPNRYRDIASRTQAYDRMLDALRGLPGVNAVALISWLPLGGEWQVYPISAEEDARPTLERPLANYRFVSSDLLKLLSIPIRRGRPFTDADRDPSRATVPALLSEQAAARAWPDRDPIGRRFRSGDTPSKPYEVVGIVPDSRMAQIDGPAPLMVYAPYWAGNRNEMAFVLHTTSDARVLMAAVRHTIVGVDPEIAIANARPMADIVDAAIVGRRFQVALLVAFGGIALAIVCIGVFTATAYSAARRRREASIRLALGAETVQIIRFMVWQGFWPVMLGLAGGVIGAVGSQGIVRSLLFDVRSTNPFIIFAIVVIVGTSSLLACVLAAPRRSEFDPASILKEE